MEQQTDREVLELARCWFEEIKEKCSRLTTGNVSHMGATIRALAKDCVEYIDLHSKSRKMTKNELTDLFDNARKLVVEGITETVSESDGTIELGTVEHFTDNGGSCVNKMVFKRLFIKDGLCFCCYESGEGYEPYEMKEYEEELDCLTMDELYEIINFISKH